MLKLIVKYRSFFVPYGLLLFGSGVYLLMVSRAESHIFLNQFVTESLNPIFKWITYFGDGNFIAFVVLVLLFLKYKYALLLAISSALSGLFTNFLKHQFFDNLERPYWFFKYYYSGDFQPELVYSISEMNIHNSFPSGHTTGAFCLFVVLMITVNKPRIAWVFFLLAVLAGYSRIYLSQHFLVDVFFGSIIGCSFAILGALVLQNLEEKYNWKWWNKSLLKWN